MADHHLIWDFFNVFMTAKIIKQDEEKRKKSVRFAITSIIFSVVAVAFAFGSAFLLSLLTGGNTAAVMLFIFTIAGLVGCAAGALMMLISALLRVIAQLTINRKAIGWIALAVFIVCVVGCFVPFVILL